ncbi:MULTISPECIES: hypothetical protein [Mycobacteriaceae]|uniref:hypothetical protein n=1 Tax=Mycobacteriaceae TaxID=1762 RepID=UPI0007EBB06D|nr:MULTISPECIES: hypothetical protein [Mycobacteriaceae]OBF65750.1 hypothetical protein A5751_03205 [Mycolicibacterium fortuitum]TMS51099.1 hypothetical protein E0T84_21335 [Mycobacterium sp. DBP42]
MRTVAVNVHLDIDRWDATQTAATRISRAGRPDQWLTGDDRARGSWDGVDAAGVAVAIARRHGLDPGAELPHVRETQTAFADERDDPRWIVEFHIGQ